MERDHKLKTFKSLTKALSHARCDLESDDSVNVCRFPDLHNFCKGRDNMDFCNNCMRIDSREKLTSDQLARIIIGGN